MNENQPLRLLPPPAGGWQRLLARREAAHHMQPWLPLLAGCASTLVLLLLLVPPLKLQLPLNGARLVGERSEGAAPRSLAGQVMTPLPTDDPQVRIFWMAATPAGK